MNRVTQKEAELARRIRKVYQKRAQQHTHAVLLGQLGDCLSERAREQASEELCIQAANLYLRAELLTQTCSHAQRTGDVVLLFLNMLIMPENRDFETIYLTVNHVKKELLTLRKATKSNLQRMWQTNAAYDKLTEYPDMSAEDFRKEEARVDAVITLHQDISAKMVDLFALIVRKAMNVLGVSELGERCAFLCLGSAARQDATPYSDVEYVVLVQDYDPDTLSSVRRVCWLVHMMFVMLGETVIPALHYLCFTEDHKYGGKCWYYDHNINGFAIDGSMPKACKTGLGRHATEHKKRAAEFIKTPADMAALCQDHHNLDYSNTDDYIGYRISTVILLHRLAVGNEKLYEDFKQELATAMQNASYAYFKQEIIKDICNTERIYYLGKSAALIKEEFFRFVPLFLHQLCYEMTQVNCVSLQELVRAVRDMPELQTARAAHHLTVLLAVGAESRLTYYLRQNSQVNNSNPRHYPELAFRYYISIIPLIDILTAFKDRFGVPLRELDFSRQALLYDVYWSQAEMLQSLGKYDESVVMLEQEYEQTKRENNGRIESTARLAMIVPNFQLAKRCLDRIRATASPMLSGHYMEHGYYYRSIGDYQQSVTYYQKSLEEGIGDLTEYKKGRGHSELGISYTMAGQYELAKKHHHISLELRRDDPEYYMKTQMGLLFTYLCTGEHEEALGLMRDIARKLVDVHGQRLSDRVLELIATHPERRELFELLRKLETYLIVGGNSRVSWEFLCADTAAEKVRVILGIFQACDIGLWDFYDAGIDYDAVVNKLLPVFGKSYSELPTAARRSLQMYRLLFPTFLRRSKVFRPFARRITSPLVTLVAAKVLQR